MLRRKWWLAVIWVTCPAFAHEPITTQLTWTNEISRLMDRHCTACHQEGGQAMSLMTYQDARPWAKAIRDEVLERRMPPWDAVKGVGDFRNDMSLTTPEIDLIVRWVEGGSPEGNRASLIGRGKPVPVASDASAATGVRVSGSSVLSRSLLLRGVYPEGPLELTALLPDRTVKRILWVVSFREKWNRVYRLREALLLPKGTTILVRSREKSRVRLLTAL